MIICKKQKYYFNKIHIFYSINYYQKQWVVSYHDNTIQPGDVPRVHQQLKESTGWNVLYNYIVEVEEASPLREGNTVSISMSFWGNECGGNDIGLLTWSTEVRRSMDVERIWGSCPVLIR